MGIYVDSLPGGSSSSSTTSKPNWWGLGLVVLPPMLGGFLYGFDIGATSFVLAMLTSSDDSDDDGWWTQEDYLSSARQGLIVSSLSLGALLGSHVVLVFLANRIGRRRELRLCALFYILGAMLNVASGTVLKESPQLGFISLCLGRILYGIGVGFVMHGAPAYLAEMSPSYCRGAIVSFKETVIVGGIVVGNLVGNSIARNPERWSWTDLYGFCGLAAIPMMGLTYYIPRSTRWLLLQGLEQEAYESMTFLYQDGDDLLKEFEILKTNIIGAADKTYIYATVANGKTQLSAQNRDDDDGEEASLWDPRYRKALTASMGLIIFQQLSAQPSILSYATVIFRAAGWPGYASVLSSVLLTVTSSITVMLVDRVGRRILLCAGCLLMATALSGLAVSFWDWTDDNVEDVESSPTQRLVILGSMLLYIAAYQVGFGPITWCIVSEIFPLEVRSKAIALGVETNFALNFAVGFFFPQIRALLGWGRTFGLFGSIMVLAVFFIRTKVPETKGLSLEEIRDVWDREKEDTGGVDATETTNLLRAALSDPVLLSTRGRVSKAWHHRK